ncbi:MAG: hypothetical protein EPO52_17625 [Herbiconiux sp.]|uniref:hypothetical protein n=1 Tax=Herbiconiux sp. TaxID=1871186 RepID=UPI001211D77B|nr:hypothetical protein [Herbiconiux sp.]TAJ46353.1 MAG: hypothetical protein EPO52_17625 [Herbiconiux sp.]
MSKFENLKTGVVVSVDDSKDDRFVSGWKLFGTASPATKSDAPDKSWKVEELKAYAEEHTIDLGEATKKDDIIAVIAASSTSPAGE